MVADLVGDWEMAAGLEVRVGARGFAAGTAAVGEEGRVVASLGIRAGLGGLVGSGAGSGTMDQSCPPGHRLQPRKTMIFQPVVTDRKNDYH